jgi:osmotically-inducible protein OsmY
LTQINAPHRVSVRRCLLFCLSLILREEAMKDDLKLQQRVIDELEFEPQVDAAHIGVSVRSQIVTLSGHVGSYMEKFAAERAVRRVKGVAGIAQELEVRLPSEAKTSDDEIAARAVKILNWDALVPHGRITVKVEHGIVTLSGEVEWDHQRAEAVYDVRKLNGVTAIINDIVVRPRADAQDVRNTIKAALERNAAIEAQNVTIAVSGGKVTLGGKVNAWTEREAIERAAWSTPGVTEVEDEMELTRP